MGWVTALVILRKPFLQLHLETECKQVAPTFGRTHGCHFEWFPRPNVDAALPQEADTFPPSRSTAYYESREDVGVPRE
jgi:hypothetical protein